MLLTVELALINNWLRRKSHVYGSASNSPLQHVLTSTDKSQELTATIRQNAQNAEYEHKHMHNGHCHPQFMLNAKLKHTFRLIFVTILQIF